MNTTTRSLYEVQMAVADMAFCMMRRGIPIDANQIAALKDEIEAQRRKRHRIVNEFLEHPVPTTFFGSPKQIKETFDTLGAKPGTNRKTKAASFDDEALFRISIQLPDLAPLCYAIIEYRSLGTMLSNFIKAKLEPGGLLRTSYNTAGPETFRWSSSENVFYRGCNVQNITTGDRCLTGAVLPNLRTAIVPPSGYLLIEPDLAGADAQVVAWDSGDELLKQIFREGRKPHAERAKWIYGASAGLDGKREPYYTLAKKGSHAYHYGATPRTVAASLGITVQEAERFRARLWSMHPDIPKWQRDVERQLYAKRMVTNAFGYRCVYLDRPGNALPQALAWLGQGTVACVVNRVMLLMEEELPEVVMFLQNHDSFGALVLETAWAALKPRVREQFQKVVVPYPDPLIIPAELKTSPISWGHMEKEPW